MKMIFLCSDANTPRSVCTDGELRLSGGSHPFEGRLEICINNAWGTVCSNSFSSDDARVACHVLNETLGSINGMKLIAV